MHSSNKDSLSGRRFLVTGASSGIGLATAQCLSERGAKIVLVGRDEARLALALGTLDGTGHGAEVLDLSDSADVPDQVRLFAEKYGRFHGLVHCAGIHKTLPLRAMESDTLGELFSTNVTAGFMLVKGIRHKQVRGESLSIVLLSSAVGLVGQSGVSAYSASKGAVISAAKSLALELARESIRVNCVCPGVVMTPMTEALKDSIGTSAFAAIETAHPLGLGEARDVANAITFLLSDDARWITGTALSVDGGYTAS